MPTPAYARLETADGTTVLELGDATGIYVAQLDLGFPTIRAVTQPRPDADGELDQTTHIGARGVTLSGTIVPPTGSTDTRQQILDRLLAFLNPAIRPYLVYQLEPDGDARRIRLRADQHTAPIVRPHSAGFSVSWRGPDGTAEGNDETTITIDASADIEAGRTYDLVFDRVYPASPPIGTVTVTNAGNATIYPIIRLYGPVTGPNIENETTGQAIELPGLVVAAGDYIELDTRARTIELLGDPTQSRASYYDFDASEWFGVVPSDNQLRYYPSVSAPGAVAEIIYRPAWL